MNSGNTDAFTQFITTLQPFLDFIFSFLRSILAAFVL